MTEDELVQHYEGDRPLQTTRGVMDRGALQRRVTAKEDEGELTHTIEYWDDDELVHRSVHVQLKSNVVAETIAEFIGG